MVPRVPTPEMVQASNEISCRAEGEEHWAAMLAAAPQPPAEGVQAGNGCHCVTCTCDPNMTPALRFDLSPAQKEGAIREHLIRLGWTPPDEAEALRAEVERANSWNERVSVCRDHVADSVDGPCVICALDAAEASADKLRAEVDALREALEEIRSRSTMNLAMQPDLFALATMLGAIYQIADIAIDRARGKAGQEVGK